jgi:Flp pilus assembly pilin Flp
MPWRASVQDPASLLPPASVFIDILPYALLFGVGISLVVAPLTSTLMGSISGRFSGLGSAINNSIARVGQPLIGAIIFIPISAIYYASLASLTGVDTTDPAVRKAFQPLNPPASATADQIIASNRASIEAYHVAMLLCAGLLAIGVVVAWYGLREGAGAAVGAAEPAEPAAPAA